MGGVPEYSLLGFKVTKSEQSTQYFEIQILSNANYIWVIKLGKVRGALAGSRTFLARLACPESFGRSAREQFPSTRYSSSLLLKSWKSSQTQENINLDS
jgi:hypothetical protein